MGEADATLGDRPVRRCPEHGRDLALVDRSADPEVTSAGGYMRERWACPEGEVWVTAGGDAPLLHREGRPPPR